MDDVLIPYQTGKHIDPMLIVFYLSGLLGAFLIGWGLSCAKIYVLAIVSERIGANMRTATYNHLLTLSLDYFGEKRTGDLISRLSSESDRICSFLSVHLLDFVTNLLMMAMTIPILFFIDFKLALITFIPLPFIAWLIHKMRDRMRANFQKIDWVWAQIANVLAETIPGVRVVKAFAQEAREGRRFYKVNRHNLNANIQLNKFLSIFYPTIYLFTDFGTLIVWGFGIWQVSRGEIKVGVLTAFIAYIARFYGQVSSLSRIVSVTQKAASATKRVFDILDHQSNVPEPKNPVGLTQNS
jgi:ATP-binding cassette subfamily B protein